MASPQKENGYTAIANEIMEALCKARIPGEGMRILIYILRMSYGFNHKNCKLSYAEIGRACDMPRQRVARVINSLIDTKIVTVPQNGDRCKQVFEFNKDYDKWSLRDKKTSVPQNGDSSVPQNGDSSVPQNGDSLDVLPIDERNKEIKTYVHADFEMSSLLYDLIKERNPNYKKPNLEKWAVQVNKIQRIDKRDYSLIEKVIRWAQADTPDKHSGKWSGWANNILSPEKLREKFDILVLRMSESSIQDKPKSYQPEFHGQRIL